MKINEVEPLSGITRKNIRFDKSRDLSVPCAIHLHEIEKGGVRFMNAVKTDVTKKKRGARIAAVVMIVIFMLWDIGIVLANYYDPVPLPVVLLLTVPPLIAIIGILIALKERMSEINGGEEDEAADY